MTLCEDWFQRGQSKYFLIPNPGVKTFKKPVQPKEKGTPRRLPYRAGPVSKFITNCHRIWASFTFGWNLKNKRSSSDQFPFDADIWKSPGSNHTCGRLLSCVEKMAPFLITIFKLPFDQQKVPMCKKQSIVKPVAHTNRSNILNGRVDLIQTKHLLDPFVCWQGGAWSWGCCCCCCYFIQQGFKHLKWTQTLHWNTKSEDEWMHNILPWSPQGCVLSTLYILCTN